MIYGILIFFEVIVSALLIVVILMQSGKGGGLAGTLGGGASMAVFGSQGADRLMTRLTTGLAAAFMILAILISIAGGPATTADESIVQQKAAAGETAPLQPITTMEIPELEGDIATPLPPESDTESDKQ